MILKQAKMILLDDDDDDDEILWQNSLKQCKLLEKNCKDKETGVSFVLFSIQCQCPISEPLINIYIYI